MGFWPRKRERMERTTKKKKQALAKPAAAPASAPNPRRAAVAAAARKLRVQEGMARGGYRMAFAGRVPRGAAPFSPLIASELQNLRLGLGPGAGGVLRVGGRERWQIAASGGRWRGAALGRRGKGERQSAAGPALRGGGGVRNCKRARRGHSGRKGSLELASVVLGF